VVADLSAVSSEMSLLNSDGFILSFTIIFPISVKASVMCSMTTIATTTYKAMTTVPIVVFE